MVNCEIAIKLQVEVTSPSVPVAVLMFNYLFTLLNIIKLENEKIFDNFSRSGNDFWENQKNIEDIKKIYY